MNSRLTTEMFANAYTTVMYKEGLGYMFGYESIWRDENEKVMGPGFIEALDWSY